MRRTLFAVVTLAVMAGSMAAQQPIPRRATMRGGGSADRGKCTIEVWVDGAAEVEVRGDSALLRNISGQPAQWRRFECSGVMPANPGDFRFQGIDGRGSQQLVRDPRNGGVAVVRIDDPRGGAEGYTFDLIWSNAGPPNRGDDRGYRGGDRDRGDDRDRGGDRERGDRNQDAFYRDRSDWFRGENWRGQLFQRVRDDVRHVQAMSFSGGDQYRLSNVIQELDELQGKLAAGRYDERELDDVVGALQRVVADNRMFPRDREILNDDLNRLRDFRARHDDYGARLDRGRDGGRDDGAYYRDRDAYFRGGDWRQRFFQRIRQDIEHAQAGTFPFTGAQFRLSTILRELDDLQNKLSAGRYDERELDDVIGGMQRVVGENRLSQRDRDALTDDLNRLREFRERHESWGAR